jgi:hypothetical protein
MWPLPCKLLFRRLRERLRRPAFVLLALNVAAFLAFTLPRALQVRNLNRRVASLRAEADRERTQVEALKQRADTVAFFGTVLPDPKLAERLLAAQTVHSDEELARLAGSSAERREWQRQCNLGALLRAAGT